MKEKLIRVAASNEAMVNGVAVSPGGRVFSSFPRWTDKPTPGVAEAMPDGRFRPFPGGNWNAWAAGLPAGDRFVSVHAVFADKQNYLWVVDDAAPSHRTYVPGGPKLVKISLATNEVERVYALGPDLAPPGTVLGHVRHDQQFAYVTDANSGSIIVLDLASSGGRRLLSTHPKTRADPSIIPIVDGKEFRRSDGNVPVIHVNLLELSHDGQWLYFMALFGPWLRRIEIKILRDPALSDDAIGANIEDVVRVPPCAGIVTDREGNLYLSSFTQNAILKMGPERKLQILISDPRIAFPNEASVGPDGYLYFPCCQGNRIARHQPDGVSRVKLPFEVLKTRIA